MGDADDAHVTGGDEDGLMVELRALNALYDPVPTEVVFAARSAIAYRRMDAEIAELIQDAPAEPQMAGVRAVGAPNVLIFDTDGFTVEVELLDIEDRRCLLGQAIPPQAGRVVVRHGGGAVDVVVDPVGRFRAENIEPGPLSLRFSFGDRTIETDWFLT